MRLQPHLAASTVAGVAVWAGTGDPLAVPIAIAGGVLPDGDHLLDYYFKYIRQDRRFQFYLLHAWEYLIAGVVAYLVFLTEPWLLALVAGYATQLILDQVSHERSFRTTTYFITPRILKGFRAPPRKRQVRHDEYQSFIKSLPFGRAAAEKWFKRRIERK